MPTKHLLRAGLSAAIASALVMASNTATPAEPTQAPLQCAGTSRATYQPPIGPTLQTTNITLHETFACVDATITSAYATATFKQEVSCLLPSLEDTLPPTMTVTYHFTTTTGIALHSTVQYSTTVVTHPAGQTVITATGQVLSGHRQGATAIVTNTRLNLNLLECLTTGITNDEGPATLTIT